MFLATTAISDFWDESSDILFLGKWCLSYNKRNEWEGLSYQILPYPWDDRKRRHDACKYCTQVHEAILPQLSEYFNNFHGVKFSSRYWRIVIGEWLWRYIQIIYDRYTCLIDALDRDSNISTLVLNEGSYQYTYDSNPCRSCDSDLYNLQLYSQILKLLGFQFESKQFLNSYSSFKKSTFNKEIKRISRLSINKIMNLWFVLDSRPQVVFCNFNLSYIQFRKGFLFSRLKYRELFLGINSKELVPDKDTRWAFARMKGEDSFQDICFAMMEYCLPMVFLEGFNELRTRVLKYTRKIPDVILSAVGWRYNIMNAIYIAEAVEKGAKLMGVQHGGGYGIHKLEPMLDHELKVTDVFISWGWRKDKKNVLPLPAPGISENIRKYEWRGVGRKKGVFLFVSIEVSRYHDIFQSFPIGPQFKNYILWQRRFFLALKSKVRSVFLVRRHRTDRGWFTNERLQDAITGLKFDDLSVSFLERAKRSELVVIDNNSTPVLETLGLNIPTIIFWDELIWEIDSSAKFFFDELKEVKVFHDSPESAADFINDHYRNIEEWWIGKDVQEAVERFRHTYARTSKNWIDDWNTAIAGELA